MFIQAVFFSIPEAMAVAFLAYALSGFSSYWKRVLLIGLITGIFSLVFRPLIEIYFLNVLIYAATLILLFNVFKVGALWESVSSVLLALPIYILIEFISVTLMFGLIQQEPAVILDNLFLKILIFTPQLIAISLIAFTLAKFKIGLFYRGLEE